MRGSGLACPAFKLRRGLVKKHFEARNRPAAGSLRIEKQLRVAGIIDNIHDRQTGMEEMSWHTTHAGLGRHADRRTVNQHSALRQGGF